MGLRSSDVGGRKRSSALAASILRRAIEYEGRDHAAQGELNDEGRDPPVDRAPVL